MRKMLAEQEVGLDPHFRYRGKNQTRVETFSDAAFALAITLLVLSSTVPTSFEELIASTKMIIPFGLCVILIMVIWYQHYLFFLQYGLQDIRTVSINTLLIFLILVYVYPLKFLIRFLFEAVILMFQGRLNEILVVYPDATSGGIGFLMIFYGLGGASIFLTLSWLYHYAYRKRVSLALNEYEIYSTKVSRSSNLLMASIPLLSAFITIINPFGNGLSFTISGFIYAFYTPLMTVHARIVKKTIKRRFGYT